MRLTVGPPKFQAYRSSHASPYSPTWALHDSSVLVLFHVKSLKIGKVFEVPVDSGRNCSPTELTLTFLCKKMCRCHCYNSLWKLKVALICYEWSAAGFQCGIDVSFSRIVCFGTAVSIGTTYFGVCVADLTLFPIVFSILKLMRHYLFLHRRMFSPPPKKIMGFHALVMVISKPIMFYTILHVHTILHHITLHHITFSTFYTILHVGNNLGKFAVLLGKTPWTLWWLGK